jgi:phosphoribosyl-ATP pyrophosphohydrolase
MSDSLSFLLDLERVISERATADAASSYTAELFAAGTRRMAQKVGEEGVEVALAAAAGDRSELLEESADLLYHLLVLLRSADARIADVVGVLESRHR